MVADKEHFLLRQLVWTGTEWFAYFENRGEIDPLRRWNWNKSLKDLEAKISEHLNNGLDQKVAVYGEGFWFVYHEKCSVSLNFNSFN